MSKRPDFDLKKVVDEECFKKCSEFLPKFRESTQKVESELRSGNMETLDSNLELYDENEVPEVKLREEETEESILLDVGLGVFDVKGQTPSDQALKNAGVSVVDIKEDLQVKNEEPLMMEVKTKRNVKKS